MNETDWDDEDLRWRDERANCEPTKSMLAQVGISCGKNCERCYGGCPPELRDGDSYRRQPSDYIRPAEMAELCCIVSGDAGVSIRAVGTHYRQQFLQRLPPQAHFEAEIVPEPGHWYDPQAVCVDVNGDKVGYLGRQSAGMWHDIVKAVNAEGYRVVTEAIVETYTDRDDQVQIGLTLRLPSFDGWMELHRLLGFEDEYQALLTDLPADLQTMLKEFDQEVWNDPDVMFALFDRRSLMPRLEWDRLLSATHSAFLPGRLKTRFEQEPMIPWKQRQLWRTEFRGRRETFRTLERGQAVQLRDRGHTLKSVAEQLGCSSSKVSKLLKEAAGGAPVWRLP